MTENLSDRINDIKLRINAAAERTGRCLDDITLVAVTKTIESARINEAIALGGIRCIAENRVQEFLDKYNSINTNVEKHLIGHLQTNKVKYIIDKIDLIQSVDSVRLLNEINKNAKKYNKIQKILMQVNAMEEEQKYGLRIADCDEFLKHLADCENIELCGVMNIAPNLQDIHLLKENFRRVRNVFEDVKNRFKVDILSMGMSNDFELAIECGSNMVRVGSGIFKA